MSITSIKPDFYIQAELIIMLSNIKYHIKSFLPVDADTPGNRVNNDNARYFITYALKRSGQHAVINWLCSQAGDIVHFNHCNIERRKACYWISASTNRIVQYQSNEVTDSGIQQRSEMMKQLSQMKGYKNLLYSFEDYYLNQKQIKKFAKNKTATSIIILRDPYNWLASTLKRKDSSPEQLLHKVRILVKYLEIATKYKNEPCSDYLFINYNKWVTSVSYRQEICDLLGITFSKEADKSIAEIPDFGGGSSFSGTDAVLRKEKQSSSVFSRWKAYVDDAEYRELLDIPNLSRLSSEFFGEDRPY